MNWFLVIRLLSAHIVGDFLLQNKSFCEAKQNLKTVTGWVCQVVHSLIQALLTYVFVADWTCWQLPLIIFFSHIILDLAKAALGHVNMLSFILDQLLHLAILAAIYSFILGGVWSFENVNWPQVWVITLAYIMVLVPASVFIEIFNRKFDGAQDGKSLTDGGKYIGFLERILILSYILCGWMEGIGYLLAAKSVFRFGDLKNNKDLKHTEYVLVGTFLSFTVAIVVGLFSQVVLQNM